MEGGNERSQLLNLIKICFSYLKNEESSNPYPVCLTRSSIPCSNLYMKVLLHPKSALAVLVGVTAYIMMMHGKSAQPKLFHSLASCTVKFPVTGVTQ